MSTTTERDDRERRGAAALPACRYCGRPTRDVQRREHYACRRQAEASR